MAMTPASTNGFQPLFHLDCDRAAASLRDPDGDLWPVNAYSDADELNLLMEASQNADILAAEVLGARIYVYPMSISEPEPLLVVSLGRGPTLLGHELKLRERDGEDPVAFTLRLLEETTVAANALAAGRCAMATASIAAMNRPGPWSATDVCALVARELDASARRLLDNADD